jgi:electron transfer flavoprotein beta subunit
MKIVVCVSLVPDSTTKIKISGTSKSIEETGVTFVLNPYDEFAVEEAVQLKEKNGGEVIAITYGNQKSKEAIKKSYQIGVDKGIFIQSSNDIYDSFNTAKNLAEVIKEINPDIIFFGKQSIDYDNHILPGMVGEILNIPSINVVTKLTIEGSKITAEREIEGGKEIIESKLPVLIGTQKGINIPRYPNLKSIMASKNKPIEEKKSSFNENLLEIENITLPPEKSKRIIFANGVCDVPELVRLLREEAKVI